jgi:hypothetical protein
MQIKVTKSQEKNEGLESEIKEKATGSVPGPGRSRERPT